MKNNKLLKIMLIVMVAITLIAVAAVFIIMKSKAAPAEVVEKPLTSEEIVAQSVDVPDSLYNLSDDRILKAGFHILTSNPEAKTELQARLFQVKNIIIEELSDMRAEDFNGKQGKQMLAQKLMERITPLLTSDGEIKDFSITTFLIQ